MKYKKALLNQGELGELFEATSHEVGRWLIKCRLRCELTKRPTNKAIEEKYCGALDNSWTYTNIGWNPVKTVPEILKLGHKLAEVPPSWLVEPAELSGPFSLSANNPKVIVNNDGDFVAKTSCADHSKVISQLLELAYKHGTLARLANK